MSKEKGVGNHQLESSLLSKTGIFFAVRGRCLHCQTRYLQDHWTTIIMLCHTAPTPALTLKTRTATNHCQVHSPLSDHNLHDHEAGSVSSNNLNKPVTTVNQCSAKAETKWSALTFENQQAGILCHTETSGYIETHPT